MKNDRVILVDARDAVLGSESKENAHKFIASSKTPTGALHRAFSVFLFDKDDRLLLQQRAANKITFPSVWTNTCCSHQLTGQKPDEMDDEAGEPAERWLRTGDKGWVDADGHLALSGRLGLGLANPNPNPNPNGHLALSGRFKEIISRGAEKISPFEIEDVLRGHAAVRPEP